MAAGFHAAAFCIALLLVFFCADGSLVDDLSNIHNEYVCDTRVHLVKPLSVADVQEAVKTHARVVPVGAGASWNKPFFCAEPPSEDGETAANIVMTTIRPLKIDVNEEDLSAWISAGVIVGDLIAYLGNYVTKSAPRGYAMGKVPAYVNQTIAGAIATNSHGSSLQYGSLSHQVIGFKVVLADGTLAEFYPDSDPLYFKAFQVSVGRLGIVTDVKMCIIRETLVKRTLEQYLPRENFFSTLRQAQEMYTMSGSVPATLANMAYYISFGENVTFGRWTLADLGEEVSDMTAVYSAVDYEASKKERHAILKRINSPLDSCRSEEGGDIADGVEWTVPDRFPPTPEFSDPSFVAPFAASILELMPEVAGNATIDTGEAELVFPPVAFGSGVVLNDDYEVAVPLSKAVECVEGLLELAEKLDPDPGLLYPTFLRFESKEEGLLSASHDAATMWIDITDYVYYNQEYSIEVQSVHDVPVFRPRASNLNHKRLVAYLLTDESCSPGRLHWGKAGWPDPGCWNGAEHYKDTWCDFGCAVRSLDPEDKFVGLAPDRWNWEGADLDRCCNDEGYDTSLKGCSCQVIPVRPPEDCPEAPFYTNR